MNTADLIWLNGEFVAWEDAKVHVLTHALHYGTGVFEGIRAYETPNGTAIFRNQDHLERLEKSAKLYYMELPYSQEQLREVTHELIVRNGFKSCYIRPLVYRGYGTMGLFPLEAPVDVSIATWAWGRPRRRLISNASAFSLVPTGYQQANVCPGWAPSRSGGSST